MVNKKNKKVSYSVFLINRKTKERDFKNVFATSKKDAWNKINRKKYIIKGASINK